MTTMLVIRLVVSLAIIAAVLLLATKVARKRQGAGAGGALEVIARHPLTRTTSVAVVRVGDRAYVLGSGENQVTLIAETDLAALTEYTSVESRAIPGSHGVPRTKATSGSLLDGAVWKAALDGMRQMTVRK